MLDEIKEEQRKKFVSWMSGSNRNSIQKVLEGVKGMCLDSHKARKIPLELSTDGQSYTDGKSIHVSLMEMFLDPKYSDVFWMLIMKASTAHECQHVNSTSLPSSQSMASRFGKYMKSRYGFNEQIGYSIAFQFLNIIEDGRIEGIIVHKMPGLGLNFRIKNDEIRVLNSIQKAAGPDDPQKEFDDFSAQCLSYAKCGGNAIGVEKYAGHRMEEKFAIAKPYIDMGIAAYSCGECIRNVEAMLIRLSDYFATLLKKNSDFANALEKMAASLTFSGGEEETEFNQQGNENGQSIRTLKPEEPSEGQGQAGKPGQSSGEEGQAGLQAQNGEQAGGSGSEQGGQNSKEGSSATGGTEEGSGNSIKKGARKPPVENNEKQVIRPEARFDLEIEAGTDMSANFSNLELQNRGYTEDELRKALRAIEQEQRIMLPPPVFRKAEIKKRSCHTQNMNLDYNEHIIPPGTMPMPADLSAQANTIRKKVERIMKIKNRNRINVREGTLNTRALYKITAKEDNMFQKINRKKKPSVAFYLLIDNSGSMSSADKSVAARRAAAVIEDAFKGFASVKITLFCSAGGIQHYLVRDWDCKSRYNTAFNSLHSVMPCGGNKDGYSIRVASEDLASRREKCKILIVLSDGLPSDYNGKDAGKNDVRQAVAEARSMGIDVISIPFGSGQFIKGNLKEFQEMYQTVVAADPETITGVLEKIFRKQVIRH